MSTRWFRPRHPHSSRSSGRRLLHGQGRRQGRISLHSCPPRRLAPAGHALGGPVLLPSHPPLRAALSLPLVGTLRNGHGVDHPHTASTCRISRTTSTIPSSPTIAPSTSALATSRAPRPAWPPSAHPTQPTRPKGPSTALTYLGIRIDSAAMSISLDASKLAAILDATRPMVHAQHLLPSSNCNRSSARCNGPHTSSGTAAPFLQHLRDLVTAHEELPRVSDEGHNHHNRTRP